MIRRPHRYRFDLVEELCEGLDDRFQRFVLRSSDVSGFRRAGWRVPIRPMMGAVRVALGVSVRQHLLVLAANPTCSWLVSAWPWRLVPTHLLNRLSSRVLTARWIPGESLAGESLRRRRIYSPVHPMNFEASIAHAVLLLTFLRLQGNPQPRMARAWPVRMPHASQQQDSERRGLMAWYRVLPRSLRFLQELSPSLDQSPARFWPLFSTVVRNWVCRANPQAGSSDQTYTYIVSVRCSTVTDPALRSQTQIAKDSHWCPDQQPIGLSRAGESPKDIPAGPLWQLTPEIGQTRGKPDFGVGIDQGWRSRVQSPYDEDSAK